MKSEFSFQLKSAECVNTRALAAADVRDCIAIIPPHALDRWTEKALLSAIETKNSLNIGFYIDARLVGFASLAVVLDELELHYIAVAVDMARKGLAYEFLHHFFSANKPQLTTAFLEVRRSNAAAIHLYEKLGFCLRGERKNYYPAKKNMDQAQEDALCYTLAFDK